MVDLLGVLERIARRIPAQAEGEHVDRTPAHPFDERNIHRKLPANVKKLFDDGHYAEATFAACKCLEDAALRVANETKESGEKLMMKVFNENSPAIQLPKSLVSISELDEQRGYRHLYAGCIVGVRNPRGHGMPVVGDPDTCLDHLSFVSHLLRKLEQAGHKL